MYRLNNPMRLSFDWVFDVFVLDLFFAHQSINVCTSLQTNKIINTLTKRQYNNITIETMRLSKTASTFYVKLHLPNKPPDEINTLIVLQPKQVQFINYSIDKVNLTKIDMRNQSKKVIDFTIIQPSKAYFEVKYKKNQLNPKQSMELYISLSPQKQKLSLSDYFIIKFDKDKSEIHVPIVCHCKPNFSHKVINRRYLKSNKQNDVNQPQKEFISMFTLNDQSEFRIRNRNISIGERIKVQDSNKSFEIKEQLIREFLKNYTDISQYVKQKSVRNQVYLGQKNISLQKREEINQFSNQIKILAKSTLEKETQQRFNVVYSQSGSVIQIFTNINLKWNKNKNIPQLTLLKGLSKVQQEVRKHIVGLRFQKIKGSLKYYKQYYAKSERQNKKIKIEDYLDNLNHILQKANKTDEYDFSFNKNSLNPTNLKVQYSTNYYEQKFQFQINQRIGFDNWIPITELKPSNQQIYCFTPIEPNESWNNFTVFDGQNRKGAYQQYPYKLPYGEGSFCQIETLLNQMNQKKNQDQNQNCEELFNFSNQLFVYKQSNFDFDMFEFEEQELDSFAKINNAHKNNLSSFNTIRWWHQNIETYFQSPYESELQRYIKINNLNQSFSRHIIGKPQRQDLIKQQDFLTAKYKRMIALTEGIHKQSQQLINLY